MALKTNRWLTMCALTLALPSWAGWVRTGEASAGFAGKGPAGFKIDGKAKDVALKDDGKVLTIVVRLADLTTGIELRDSHMRDKYLEVANFPVATLAVPLDAFKVPEDGKSVSGEARGTFSIHGKSKELPFKYSVSRQGDVYTVEGDFDLNYKDYGISVPNYMGITVKPDIHASTKFQAKKEG